MILSILATFSAVLKAVVEVERFVDFGEELRDRGCFGWERRDSDVGTPVDLSMPLVVLAPLLCVASFSGSEAMGGSLTCVSEKVALFLAMTYLIPFITNPHAFLISAPGEHQVGADCHDSPTLQQ